jgi:hypothetical protein
MIVKVETYRNGWTVTMDKAFPQGMYTVLVRNAAGNVHDRIRCDDYRAARDYYRAFNAIAKNA